MSSSVRNSPALDKALAIIASSRAFAASDSPACFPLSLRSAISWEEKAKALDSAGKNSNLAWQRVDFLASRALKSLIESHSLQPAITSPQLSQEPPTISRVPSRRRIRAFRRQRHARFLWYLLAFIAFLICLAFFSAL